MRMMKNLLLPVLILITGTFYIFAIPSGLQEFKLLFKLIPMWLIILYAYFRLPSERKAYHWLILIGLFFCMLGDGLLGWSFVIGLSAFLVGHLFYMSSFFKRWSFSKLRFWTLAPLVIYGTVIGWNLIKALNQDNNESLIIPVILYILVISLMTWSAIMTGNKWAIVGSILFTISDSILSWNKFVDDVAYAGSLIMITYYTAQFCIAHSITTHSNMAITTPNNKGQSQTT